MILRRDVKTYIQVLENILNRYKELEFELYHTYTNSYMLKDFFHDIIIYINERNRKKTLIKEEREYNLNYTLESVNSLIFYLDVIVKNHIKNRRIKRDDKGYIKYLLKKQAGLNRRETKRRDNNYKNGNN